MLKSRWSKVLGIVSLTALLAGLAGCERPNVNSPSGEESDVASAESELGKPDRMRHRPHGPGMLLGAALHELDLSDAQKAKIELELDALRPADGEQPDHDASRKALAAAVRSGKIDESALLAQAPKPHVDQARVAKALTVLHDTLTPEQRRQLVDALAAKMDRSGDHEGKGRWGHEGKERKGHEGKEGKERKGHEGKAGRHGERGEQWRGAHGPMGHLLRGLDLTDQQREAVREAMQKGAPSEADRETMKASHEALRKGMRDRLESFASESFDATAAAALPEGKAGHKDMYGRMVKTLAAVTPILTDAQREALAKRIEEGPMGRPHMGKERGRGE